MFSQTSFKKFELVYGLYEICHVTHVNILDNIYYANVMQSTFGVLGCISASVGRRHDFEEVKSCF